jgi:predicted RNA-binding Zn ribbon-like protein
MTLIGEPLALDLINTRTRDADLLATPDTFKEWLSAQAGRMTIPDAEIDLNALRSLRQQIEDAVEHARSGQAPPARALQALNAALRAAPAYRKITWPGVSKKRDGDATQNLLAELAEAAVDLLTDPAVAKVRSCDGPGCRLLFLPAHPRRRWCSPTQCGNRTRVARYYQRHAGPHREADR